MKPWKIVVIHREERLHHALLPLQIRSYRLHQRSGKNSIRPAARHQESHQSSPARRRSQRNLSRRPPGFCRFLASAQLRSLRHRHRRHRRQPRRYTSAMCSFITTTRTRSTTTGLQTSGPPSTPIRSFRASTSSKPACPSARISTSTAATRAPAPSPTIKTAKSGPSPSSTTRSPKSKPNRELSS